jgi:hypothetical protein
MKVWVTKYQEDFSGYPNMSATSECLSIISIPDKFIEKFTVLA